MKKNFMKSMAMGALLLSVVACNGGASSSQANGSCRRTKCGTKRK